MRAAAPVSAGARVGIVGGLGPESTVDYYRRILDACERAGRPAPAIVIDSLDVQLALRLVAADDRAGLADYLLASVQRLARAGADFVAISANTPHLVFDEVASRAPLPMLSLVDSCADALRARDVRRVALFGTKFTMEADFYPAACRRAGIDVLVPDAADREWMHHCYVEELLRGAFRPEMRERFTALAARLRDDRHPDAVLLAGTELPLLLPGDSVAGLPLVDSTAVHVDAIVARLMGQPA